MRLLLTAVAVFAIACSQPTGPERVRTLGVVVHYDDGPELTVPDTVTRGETFLVEVVTFGSRTCHEFADTEVEMTQTVAIVAPYDNEVRWKDCDDVLVWRLHTAALRFDAFGDARIIIRGREEPSGREIEITRDIVVR